MTFTSIAFLPFAALLLVIYYLIPKKGQWMLLLAASTAFYLFADWRYFFFLLVTVFSVYVTGMRLKARKDKLSAFLSAQKETLTREERKKIKASHRKIDRVWLIGCLVVNFGMLAFCKGLLINPFRESFSGAPFGFLTLALPLGMSYYMFQSMGYVIDVYRGTAEAQRNPFKLALFTSFFPQLMLGPINKYNFLAPTLFAEHPFEAKRVSFGLQRMLWGFFKKLVIADRIAVAIGTLKGDEYTGVAFLVLAVFYAVQIYGDFTGGIDIALGLSEALGVTMTENFVRPFFSKNIAEYWRRWHISLGEWMKDYIFYPPSVCSPMLTLSKKARAHLGNFGKRLPVYVASVATWAVTGLWHGFNAHFLLWAGLNCFFIVLSEECEPLYRRFHAKFGLKNKPWYGAFEILRMFMLMNFIRATDLFESVGTYFSRLFSLFVSPRFSFFTNGSLMRLGLNGTDYLVLLCGILLLFAVSLWQEKRGSVREALLTLPSLGRYLLLFALFLAVLLLGSYGIGFDASSFIYTQF